LSNITMFRSLDVKQISDECVVVHDSLLALHSFDSLGMALDVPL